MKTLDEVVLKLDFDHQIFIDKFGFSLDNGTGINEINLSITPIESGLSIGCTRFSIDMNMVPYWVRILSRYVFRPLTIEIKSAGKTTTHPIKIIDPDGMAKNISVWTEPQLYDFHIQFQITGIYNKKLRLLDQSDITIKSLPI